MTSDKLYYLLSPLIGKSGSLSMVVSRVGQISFAAGETKKLTDVKVDLDGPVRLVRLERATGWTVIDPGEVVAVAWNSDTESSPGQFL